MLAVTNNGELSAWLPALLLSGRKVAGELSLTKATGKQWKVRNSGMAPKDDSRLDESALKTADVAGKRQQRQSAKRESGWQQNADENTLMTVEEAAAILSVSPQTVYRWAKRVRGASRGRWVLQSEFMR